MHTHSLVLALLATFAAAAAAQQAPDTTVTLQGFVQHFADSEPETLVVPQPFQAFGVHTFVLSLGDQSGKWERFLGQYVEARGRVSPDPDGRLIFDVQRMKEVEAPGTAHRTLDRGTTMHAVITAAVIPNRVRWHDAQGKPTGVNPTLRYAIRNQRQTPIFFVLPTNNLLCVSVNPVNGSGKWNYATTVLRTDARRFTVSRGGWYTDVMQLPEDAAPLHGRYVAQVGICEVDDFDIVTEFTVE